MIVERFVFKGVCSGRDYVLPLNGASWSWELIIRCVLKKKYIYCGTCCRNFNSKRHVWSLPNSSGGLVV